LEGGAEALVRSLCARLGAHGVDVTIVSVYASGLDAAGKSSLGVPVVEIGRRGRGDLGYFPRLVRTLRELRPDIVHVHLHTGQYAGRIAALLAGVGTIVLTVHGEEPRGLVRALLDRALHARTARFVVFTEAQRRRLAASERIPRERIEAIPNGVEYAAPARSREQVRGALGICDEAFVLYAPARLCAQKNQAVAIDALGILAEQGDRDLELVLAGAGTDEAALRARAGERGLSARVHFLGFRSDAAALLPAMDLFVMPSIWERMPIALGEAMLGGLPVVSTPWEGVADFIIDGATGFIATDFTAAAFAAAIARARRDPSTLARIAETAKAFAESRFDADATAGRHASMYRALIGARA
jgi:glycosyltransferase involved in cell wall biosynthesis